MGEEAERPAETSPGEDAAGAGPGPSSEAAAQAEAAEGGEAGPSAPGGPRERPPPEVLDPDDLLNVRKGRRWPTGEEAPNPTCPSLALLRASASM